VGRNKNRESLERTGEPRRSALRKAAIFGSTLVSNWAGVPQTSVLQSFRQPGKSPSHGYTIQVRAFTNVDNAVRLTETLEKGHERFWPTAKVRPVQVRFGDYPREAARVKAEALLQAGVFTEYYIVSPEDYALARVRLYGEATWRNEIVETAERFIGLPYQWGGSSVGEGFDCSGLTMAVYQLNGLNLPRSSKEHFPLALRLKGPSLQRGSCLRHEGPRSLSRGSICR
jgi:cell wall-associated NlpC family hydrolase